MPQDKDGPKDNSPNPYRQKSPKKSNTSINKPVPPSQKDQAGRKKQRRWTRDLRKAARKAKQAPKQLRLQQPPPQQPVNPPSSPPPSQHQPHQHQPQSQQQPQQQPRQQQQSPPKPAHKLAKKPPQKSITSATNDPAAKKNLKSSTTNLTKLIQDGRKTPQQFREVALRVSSPSQISLRSISEYYDAPSDEFETIEDVYVYRGYKKIGKLDEGAFGIVYKAVRVSDNFPVALKEVDLSRRRSKRIEEMKRELYVLQKVDSPYIVKLIEHFIVGQTLVIAMELCAGNNLTHYLKESAVREEEAVMLFKQMALAIKLLHRNGIAHRDVKLNNFLLDATRKNVKIADFGLSVVSYRRECGILSCKTYCGTEPYMAPEIIRRNSRGLRQYNPMYADVWALGVCLYAMLTRTFPFKMNLTQRSLFRTQIERRWRIPRNLRDIISEELKDLLWHMLDPQPDRRISINGVTTHPWLNPDLVNLSQDES